ncbi:hypothetical protein Hanom_Chr11g01008381 [Helianthus anomalus]
MWDTFVEMKNTEEAKDKSDKARKSAQNNKIPHRTGRSGYRGLEENMPEIWPEMLKDNDYLKEINDERSQLIVAARIKKDPQTGTYDPEKYKNISDLKIDELIDTEKKMIVDGTYGKGSEDPITKVFGREHGGRTRGVSSAIGNTYTHTHIYIYDVIYNDVIFDVEFVGHTKVKGPYFKGATQRVEVSTTVNMSQPRQPIDASPGLRGPSCGSGTSHVIYPDIQVHILVY